MAPLKFLLDENVRAEIRFHLKAKGHNIVLAPNGLSDLSLAAISKSKKLILVTNDSDFSYYSSDEIYAVVLLKIPQNESEVLFKAFDRLLASTKRLKGKIVMLYPSRQSIFSLSRNIAE